MPELPEVQTLVKDMQAAGIVGRTVVKSKVFWPKAIKDHSTAEFKAWVKQQPITAIKRYGKFILFILSENKYLFVHLRMSGRFLLTDQDREVTKHEHVILFLDDGRQLRFQDTRKFGRFYICGNPREISSALGVDPLGDNFTLEWLSKALLQRKRQLKPLLLDQGFIAGLGNIYVDEALWEAGLHPLRRADTLTDRQIKALYQAILRVLKKALVNRGTSLGLGLPNFASTRNRRGHNQHFLKVYHRHGQACQRCQTPIERLIVGQRGTHICPQCQLR